MAKSYCAGKDGAYTSPTGAGASSDFMSFVLAENQAVESVAAYGAAVYEPYRGSGTPHLEADVAAFATYGATGTPAGFGGITASPGGGSATFTPGTAITLTGNCVVSQLTLQHSRIRAIAPITYHLHNSADITTTWPVS